MTEPTVVHKAVTTRVEADKVAALDRLAEQQDRDRSYLINEAIDQFLAHRQWMLAEIKTAVAEADAGKFLTDDESDTFMQELSR